MNTAPRTPTTGATTMSTACRHSVPTDRCPTCLSEADAYAATMAARSAHRATRRLSKAMRAGSVPSMGTRRGREGSKAGISYTYAQ